MGLLSGKTIVVVSGAARRAPDYRRVVESLGGTFVFLPPEDLCRAEAVRGADYVVLVTRVMSHKSTQRILRILRGDRTSIVYVNGTGISSFLRSMQETVARGSTDTG